MNGHNIKINVNMKTPITVPSTRFLPVSAISLTYGSINGIVEKYNHLAYGKLNSNDNISHNVKTNAILNANVNLTDLNEKDFLSSGLNNCLILFLSGKTVTF